MTKAFPLPADAAARMAMLTRNTDRRDRSTDSRPALSNPTKDKNLQKPELAATS